jgi:glutamine synthetase
MLQLAEYIWCDGAQPVQKLRSKSRVVRIEGNVTDPAVFPKWNYDGSSTYQASGSNSDLHLQPVRVVNDPVRGAGNYLVLCEVLNDDGTPHESNQRAKLRDTLDKGGAAHEPWLGFEQEYTLFKGALPLGWPNGGYPAPQGPFYCGVGADEVFGRDLVEAHTEACIQAGIMIYGINAEVMPGQWEFQVGYRGLDGESPDALAVSDHLWLARYLLYRLGERYGVNATLDCKPVKGDWNGAGAHTNFSTKDMRDPQKGQSVIENAIAKLEKTHMDHIKVYGHGLEDRLTGQHETCHISEFRSGVADRTASIRIPRAVADKGYGYIEDRRPGANMDPYVVAARMIQTICL